MKHRTSLQSRLLAYLRANPQAELSRQDIMDRFHAGVKHVDDTLTTMRREGLVETVHVTRLPNGSLASMSREDELENMLRMLLAMCDRLKADARDKAVVWDDRKPTIFYLQRNMEWARDLLTQLQNGTR
jgi:hypothetical protein